MFVGEPEEEQKIYMKYIYQKESRLHKTFISTLQSKQGTLSKSLASAGF